jgi:hypothetical protein
MRQVRRQSSDPVNGLTGLATATAVTSATVPTTATAASTIVTAA